MTNYLILFKYVLDQVTKDNALVIDCDYLEYQDEFVAFYYDDSSLPEVIIPQEAILYIRQIRESDVKQETEISKLPDNKLWMN